jgi:hypothetical protein
MVLTQKDKIMHFGNNRYLKDAMDCGFPYSTAEFISFSGNTS